MGLTRPQAIIRRMDAAAHGLRGAMANLARMLAIVDYEREEDERVFRLQPRPGAALRQPPRGGQRRPRGSGRAGGADRRRPAGDPGRNAHGREVANARGRNATTATIIAFKSFGGEPTATFPNRTCAGRVPCFSARDGHFDAPVADIDRWPNAEPTRQLLTELADNFWPD